MKKHFTSVVLMFICLIVLPLMLSVADDDSDVRLSTSQQKMIDEAQPEHRERLRKTFIDSRNEDRQHQIAMKKIIPRIVSHLPKMAETASERSLVDLFMQGAVIQQEFRDYVGIGGIGFAMNVQRKQNEVISKMLDEMGATTLKIAKAETDDEIDKLLEEGLDKSLKLIKEASEVVKKELNPQQIDKLKELRVVASSNNNNDHNDFVFDFGQYETLNLTDEQQKKISAIRNEYFIAFEPLLKNFVGVAQRQLDAMPDDASQEAVIEKVMKETEETKQLMVKLNAATRAKILALFTKEQIEKLENIFSNAPKYLAIRVGLIKEGEDKDAWKKSWKPGDPIPEGAVPPANPNRIFPIGF